MDRVLIATSRQDLTPYCELACAHGVGLEIQAYGYDPDLLDGGWRELLPRHKLLLRDFEGEVALHGTFYDMASASPDRRVVALAKERYRLNLDIAAELGVRCVVFHTNYLPIIRQPDYRPTWTARQVDFWAPLAGEAAARELVIALENMWEPEPGIIADLLDGVDSPHLAACLDVGHAHLFSRGLPFGVWVARLAARLVHCHLNNNRGLYDEHLPLDAEGGIVDYEVVLPLLRGLADPPALSLEMNGIDYLERSLRYLGR